MRRDFLDQENSLIAEVVLVFKMTANRPMITLRCGNYANYIGAHFWNLQEAGFVYGGNDGGSGELLEVDNDVLFREGLTMKREVTYTPRLLSIDLQGSLGLLPQCGELYGRPQIPSSESVPWEAGCQVFKEEPHKKNDFLRELDQEAMNDEASEKDIDICMDSSEKEKSRGLQRLARRRRDQNASRTTCLTPCLQRF